VCAALIVALTGGAVATAGPAHAELGGVCGTLLAGGLTAASIRANIVARGAGFAGMIISAGCLTKDLNDAAREYTLTPAAQAEYRRIQAQYGSYRIEDYMREFGCDQVTRGPSNPDDVFAADRTSWDCSSSPYARGD
jgi:hypothetical protein